jgi:hypothetical protein
VNNCILAGMVLLLVDVVVLFDSSASFKHFSEILQSHENNIDFEFFIVALLRFVVNLDDLRMNLFSLFVKS